MKKIILICFCSLLTVNLYSQDVNKIKSQNVFFILFESNDYMQKTDLSREKTEDSFRYEYFHKKINKFKFSFRYWDYKNFDDAYNKIKKTITFRLNKSFLRKNKDIIITREFMEDLGEQALISLLNGSNKHVFLIDKSEIKKGKILLREVRFDFIAEE